MSESLLTFIIDGENGFAVIRRSVELATAQNAQLHVLVLDTRGEDYANDHEVDLRFYVDQVATVGGSTQSVRSDSTTEIIETLRAVADRVGATQIIVGDDNEGALNRLLGWTTANIVMQYIPGVDLHIVGRTSDAPQEGDYEPAIPASLTEQPDGSRRLQLDPGRNELIGLFFRETDTEFDHGYFLYETDGTERVVPIRNGRADPE